MESKRKQQLYLLLSIKDVDDRFNIVRKKIDSVPNFVLGTESNRNMCISYHNECAYYINIICKNINNIQIKVAFYQKIKII